MTSDLLNKSRPWDKILAQCRSELDSLSQEERSWLNARLSAIAAYQIELDRLFRLADGPAACASCSGSCCDCGRHHFTLTNLLGSLVQGLEPPSPDYNRPCPFLGRNGCLLEIATRPFNCVTFICETVEAGLSPSGKKRFYELEKLLRNEYEAVAERYAAASLRGLLIALERMNGFPLLQVRGAESRLCRQTLFEKGVAL